jgi:hypothetical protein
MVGGVVRVVKTAAIPRAMIYVVSRRRTLQGGDKHVGRKKAEFFRDSELALLGARKRKLLYTN